MGSHRIVQHDSRMIKKLSKFSRGLALAAQPGISQTTHVDWIESSEKGATIVCRTRNSEVVRSGGLRHFERFRCVTLVESVEPAQRGQVTELD